MSFDGDDEDVDTSTATTWLISGVEDNVPLGKQIILGFQQVLVSNAWLDPVFIATVAGLTTELSINLLCITFLASGIVTFLQSTRIAKLPIVQGSSSAFDPLAIGYAKTGSLNVASTGLLVGATIVFLFAITGLVKYVRRLLSNAVTGTIMILVGVALSKFTFALFFGMPGTEQFLTASSLFLASVTTGTVILATAIGSHVRSFNFLIALLIGNICAFGMGYVDFSAVGQSPWLALPILLPYGTLEFDIGITTTMAIVFVVVVIEAMGTYEAVAAETGIDLKDRRFSNGISTEAGGSMISALFGGFGTTAYAQNLGALKLTGIANRRLFVIAGLFFIVLGFMPKFAAVLLATPAAVVGGLFVPAAATIVSIGIKLVAAERGSTIQELVAPIAIIAGIGIPPIANAFGDSVPTIIDDLAGQSIAVGALVAFFLEIILVIIPDQLSKRATLAERNRPRVMNE